MLSTSRRTLGRAPRTGMISGGVALALALAACSGGGGGSAASSTATPSTSPVSTTSALPSPTPSPTATATPTATPAPPQRSLLSGRKGEKDGQVLVVKLDNTHSARPHAGLDVADVVYLEEVEYGITRLAAVFSTRIPREIGPIRSARIADLELFAQYGKVAFAYSGAQQRLKPEIAAANLVNVSGDVSGGGYWRQSGRYAPYDFFGDGEALLDRAPDADQARDVGFRFSPDAPAGGNPATHVDAPWPSSHASFDYDAATGRWLWSMDGSPMSGTDGKSLGGSTVIVQYVDVYDSGYGDKFGGRTPMSDTVGSGTAQVFRDGKVYAATWKRKSQDERTYWRQANGRVMFLKGGQVWVLLVNKNSKADVS